MNVAIISDIHGNSIALEVILKDIRQQKVNQIYCLGDLVNYYPDCNEVISLLAKHDAISILGNHDFMVVSSRNLEKEKARVYQLDETRTNLTGVNNKYLAGLPKSILSRFGPAKVLMVHGSPLDELDGYIYPDTDLNKFESLDYDFVFCGHTHRAMIRKVGQLTFANPGSVGMPRDIGNMASYILFDSETLSCRIRRVLLPLEKIKSKYGDMVHPSVIKLLNRK